MIILVASEKGGVGKTTIATNIAVMLSLKERDVLLLDTDTQGSALDWGAIRDNSEFNTRLSVLQKTGPINREILRLVEKYDDIVIDAGGRDTDSMRSAMLMSHVWYIPVRPSQFDVWTIAKMAKIYSQMREMNPELRPYLLLNCASSHAAHNDYKDVQEALAGSTDIVTMSRACIHDRNAFRKAVGMGAGVVELPRPMFDKKAAQEIEDLYEEIMNG